MAYVDHAFSITDEDIMMETSYTVNNKPPIKEIALTIALLVLDASNSMAGSFMRVSFCPSEIRTEFRFNSDGLSSLFSESSRLGNSKLTQVVKDSLEVQKFNEIAKQPMSEGDNSAKSTDPKLSFMTYQTSVHFSPGEVVTVAQEVVSTMAAKGI